MSSCLSGGRTACAYAALDLELIKSHSPPPSSPSSTISESNCSHSPPLPLSTRKPRAQRKRPNQTYNEAAVLLSTAYPKVFSPKHLTNCKFTKPMHLHNAHNVSCTSTSSNNASGSVMFFDSDSSELLLPFRVIDHLGFPLYRPFIIQDRPCPSAASIDPKAVTTTSPCSEFYPENSSSCFSEQDEFDAESIILDDEEIEEGIDSILGNSSATNSSILEDSKENGVGNGVSSGLNFPIGLGFGGKFECGSMRMGKGVRPLRHQAADGGEWWKFPAIDVREISPKLNNNDVTATAATITAQPDKKKPKKKKKKTEKLVSLAELGNVTNPVEEETTTVRTEKLAEPGSSLLLKLNYEVVLNAWSDTGSAFPLPASELGENDSHARLAQIDLFDEGGGVRSARVLRYKEKRRTRLFSKKIRYEVRKVNADQRPRMKGRFVRRPNSAGSGGKR